MKIIFAALAVLSLSGCMSAADIQHSRQQEQYRQQQEEREYQEALRARCSSFGYQPGTPAHSQCQQQVHAQFQANKASILGAYATGLAAQEAANRDRRERELFRPIPNFMTGR